MKASTDHIAALIDERHSAIRTSFDRLLDALAQNVPENVAKANVDLLKDLEALGMVVARQDWPQWLSDLVSNCRNYETNHRNGLATWKAHLLSLINNRDAMLNYHWFAPKDEKMYIDIDQIVDDARKEFAIDSLFDKIVATLEKMVLCEELDSVKVRHDLERIIGMLNHSRSGTFISEVSTWQFARRFIPNLLSEFLKDAPILGQFYKAFEQTAQELDVNLGDAKDKIGQDILNAVSEQFKTNVTDSISSDQIKALPDFSNIK
ncbi:hypothetical protein [Sandarakinorhabdus sp.]|uniref:hypothetical protein n=1 Tax=Sandarakinorhabdus sp. TaxID=1916663 RepID=UPI003341CFB1